MDSTQSTIWVSYLPHHVARELIEQPEREPTSQAERFTAVVLFADVSGFTAISEALAATGRNGSEELTRILNSYFEPMIDLIYSYGGIIGKFGGDAMTVLFPYTSANRSGVVKAALACALAMQARMTDYAAIPTPAGTYSLAMKAGLAAGSILVTSVGDRDIRLEYIIAGEALDLCADAEHHASRGEVVIHEDLLAWAGNADVVERHEGFYLLTAVLEPVTAVALPQLPEPSAAVVDVIATYIHPSIAQRLRRGQLTFINEHRKVTVLFVRFRSYDYDSDAEVVVKLQHYLQQVIRTVKRYDGYLNKVDMGDKGSKYIILFGAPIAHEDDEERALRCAVELQELSEHTIHIGVNTGFVYCGQVGSARRQEYTVMGDAVNLSARLMQAAPVGHILVGDSSYQAGHKPFEWTHNSPMHVKGKSEPVAVHTLIDFKPPDSQRLEPDYALPMVGRATELKRIATIGEQVLAQRGQIVGITAEAGMGKSRLTAEIIQQSEPNMKTVVGECQSYGTNTAYLVWHNLLRRLFRVDPSWSLDVQIRHLESQLILIDPTFVARLPLLGLPLNLPIPDNATTQSMDAKVRKESLEGLLVTCVRHMAQERPLCLVLEDCHWLDALSNDLLAAIGRNIVDVPILIVTVYRPPETERITPQARQFGHFTEMRLEEFSQAEAAQLIGLKLAALFDHQEQVSEALVQRITERAQGNPFYIDEMINLIHDQGLNPSDQKALEHIELPDSLHSLIISRIDRLTEGPKTTLKVASVIGRLFNAHWLWHVYPQLGAPESVRADLERLSILDLTPLDKPEPELEYLFKHIITREVAYESLAVSTRAMLHETIGGYIEQIYVDELDQHLSILAYHYGASYNEVKQRHYFAKAADFARKTYANNVAIEYYQKLLPLLPQPEQVEIMIQLGQILQLVGQWDEAQTSYQRALANAKQLNDSFNQALAQQALGTLFRTKGSYEQALHWLELARKTFWQAEKQDNLVDTLREIGYIQWHQGNIHEALQFIDNSRQLAVKLNNQKGIYKALGNLGIVYWSQSNYAQALSHYKECYSIALQLGDKLGIGLASVNVGNVYFETGNYARALNAYIQGLQISSELGYRQGISLSINNMGEIYSEQGAYTEAIACGLRNLAIDLSLGDRYGVSFAAWNLARAYMAQQQMDLAEGLLRRAIHIGKAIDIPYELSDYLVTQAHLYTAKGEYGLAHETAVEAMKVATSLQKETAVLEATILLVGVRVQMGKQDKISAMAELQSLLNGVTTPKLRADIQYALWELAPDGEHGKVAAATYQTLYEETPNILYRQRYETMTGEKLPDPPSLPPLPEVVTRQTHDPQALLTQVDVLIAELQHT